MPSPEEKFLASRSESRLSPMEPEDVRIELLGGFRVSVGTRVLREDAWRLRKGANLVKLAALAPDHRLHRERVMDLLWPDLDPKAATNNLHYALYVARRTLDPEPGVSTRYLRLRGDHLELCPLGALWIDVEAFEAAVATARRTREPAAYRFALDLYAGDLLPAERYEVWTEGRREELRRKRLALLVELARLYEARGEHSRAIESLEQVVADESTHEEAHTGLMRLHASVGHPFRAVLQYERLGEVLRRQLDKEPDVASRRLYRQILSGRLPAVRLDVPDLAPAGPSDSLRHNLPSTLSSFVGREREMAEIKRAVSMTRLLTLTGPGGCGKTRLALEVSRDLLGSFPDGVWMVELAPLANPELVTQSISAALGVREEPIRPPLVALSDHLQAKDLMLVLDNCEHLIDVCAHVVETLLSTCPRLRVLATSREAMNVGGELIWLVQPLPVPDEEHTFEQLAGNEAVRLFVERTYTRLPAFELTSRNAQSVAEVCRKLDGIPLAIELATARMSVLAVEGLVEKLDDSLGPLTGGFRTADPRQRTLRGALEWSYGPLGKPEQTLFDRLSVFAGGWTFEAAEAVCSGEGIARDEVLDLLSSLANKSLVIVSAEKTGVLRYTLLEPVRQYGMERLEAGGEAGAVRRRHAEHYLALAEEAEPGLLGAGAVSSLEILHAERDNLRAALTWALGQGDRTEVGLRAATALERFWLVYGMSEGRGWLERGLAASGVSPRVRARALNQAGWISLFQGGQGKAISMLEESKTLFEELGDRPGMATSLANLGFAVAHMGDDRRLATMREEAEALRREPLERRTLAHLLHFLTLAALYVGDLGRALALATESLSLYRRLEDIQGTAISLTALGMIKLGAREPDQAQAFFEENLGLLRSVGDKMGVAYCLLGLAGVADERARPERAARLWGAAESLREQIGMQLSPLDRSYYHYEERLASARSLIDGRTWDAAWSEGREMGPEEAIEYALSEEIAPTSEAPPAIERPKSLTPRELEVAENVALGKTNRQVATELSISERTVHTHVRRILRKLGLTSRAQITAWVIENRPRRDGR